MNFEATKKYGLAFRNQYKFGCVALGHSRVRLCPGSTPFNFLEHGAQITPIGPTGGEMNVALNLSKSAKVRTAALTALVNGDPWDGFIRSGYMAAGVNIEFAKEFGCKPWGPLYGEVFSPLGFGEDSPKVDYHLANEAAAQLKPGDFNYEAVFGSGAVYAHCGGIFLTVGEETPKLAIEFYQAAKRHGTITSFDANYRGKLWEHRGGIERAQKVCREIAESVDILEGNKNDLRDALGIKAPEKPGEGPLDIEPHKEMILRTLDAFPNIKAVLTNLRHEIDANHHYWTALTYIDGEFYQAPVKEIFVIDRVGGGDATTSYFLWALMNGKPPQEAIDIAWAAGALKTATIGDTLKSTFDEVISKAKAGRSGAAAEIQR